MIGAIIGDIAGSTYEFYSIKTMDFPLFAPGSNTTDDSLMSIDVASVLMQTGEGRDFRASVVSSMRQIAAKYPCPMGGYGGASGTGWFRQIPAPTAALATVPRCAFPRAETSPPRWTKHLRWRSSPQR